MKARGAQVVDHTAAGTRISVRGSSAFERIVEEYAQLIDEQIKNLSVATSNDENDEFISCTVIGILLRREQDSPRAPDVQLPSCPFVLAPSHDETEGGKSRIKPRLTVTSITGPAAARLEQHQADVVLMVDEKAFATRRTVDHDVAIAPPKSLRTDDLAMWTVENLNSPQLKNYRLNGVALAPLMLLVQEEKFVKDEQEGAAAARP
ncbi:unnamed protein product [Amoebophrya sp. A120]|nr:unnamed protein product [Amoebophrya sp. A120]|eukprot:GSA120T00020443001.1